MQKPTHTPGPWHIANSKSGHFCVWGDASHRQQGYSECCICVISPIQNITTIDKANAALIAAAPDLLEAAKQALQVFVDQGWDDDLSAAKSLKAAIAKAEGKA
jgi:hypothetical protein